MREIKFRAWMINSVNPNGKMYYPGDFLESHVGKSKLPRALMLDFNGLPFSFKASCPENLVARERLDADNENVSIMQYTGLKDKHGTEIYEGDIVRWLIDSEFGPDAEVYEIKYEDNQFTPLLFTGVDGDNYMFPHEVEVIGNIHENPELLEEQPCQKA